MSRGDHVRDLEPQEYPAWEELVEKSPTGSVYATPTYLEELCRATGGCFSIRAAFHGDEITGGVGLYREGEGIAATASPRLLLYYNGPVLRRYTTRYPGERLSRHGSTLEALEKSLRSEGMGSITLKGTSALEDVRPFLAEGWRARPEYTIVVPVDDLEEQWSRVDRNVRRLVRRARKRGLRVTEDDDFASFFRLHLDVHRRKAVPLYLPEDRFRRYVQGLRARGMLRLYHARLPDGRAISSQVVLSNGHPITHTVSAASDDAYGQAGASHFLRWSVFEDLHERGYEANDLTGADLGSVTRFKNQFGGELRVCFEVSRVRPEFRALQMPARLGRTGRRLARRVLAPLMANGGPNHGG